MNARILRKPDSLADDSFPRQSYPPGRILIVNDDTCLGELNAEALRQHGYDANTASDGQAGWEELQTNHYHLLITENDLPGLSGVGLVKKLRAACMPLPVIMVTEALPSWKSPEYSWLLKATRLLKPYSCEELRRMVINVLNAAVSTRKKVAPPPAWQLRPRANRFRP